MTTPGSLESKPKAGRAWLLVLLWTGVLWWLGSESGSLNSTSRFLGPLLRWLLPDAPAATLASIHFLLRKGAHVGGYGVLAFLTWRAFLASTRAAELPSALLTLAWVACIATLDEVRQGYSAVRTGSLWDVALDLSGGVLALVLAIACTRAVRARRAAREGP
jgi:VanZ family protein